MFLTLINILYSYDMVCDKILYLTEAPPVTKRPSFVWNSNMFLILINILYSYAMVYDKILYFELNFLIKSIIIVWNINQF